MKKILIKNCMCLATMDDGERVLKGHDIEIYGNRISRIEAGIDASGKDVIDAGSKLVTPGLVNTHHHFYQTLTRNLKEAQDAKLFDWLKFHYEIWRRLTPEAIYQSSRAACAELLLTGCTTAADHLYVVPRRYQSDTVNYFGQQVRAAKELGMRFHLTRGSMSRGKSKGGLPPDDVVQDEDEILKDSERIIEKFHDPSELAMLRVVLGPCSPFSITLESMRDSAALARKNGVFLHTHLCETKDEEEYSLQVYKMRPLDAMEEVGWAGPDVWYAHGIHFNDNEIARIGKSRTGIAHCPTSNMRLGSGIAKVPALLRAGARVGLAVDGSASADSSNMLRELKNTLLVNRIGTSVDAMPAMTVLRMATKGGASVLGRDEIGSIEVGKGADIVLWDMNKLDYIGALHDPVAALLFCGTCDRADTVIVDGRIVVRDKRLVNIDEEDLIRKASEESQKLINA